MSRKAGFIGKAETYIWNNLMFSSLFSTLVLSSVYRWAKLTPGTQPSITLRCQERWVWNLNQYSECNAAHSSCLNSVHCIIMIGTIFSFCVCTPLGTIKSLSVPRIPECYNNTVNTFSDPDSPGIWDVQDQKLNFCSSFLSNNFNVSHKLLKDSPSGGMPGYCLNSTSFSGQIELKDTL